MLNLILVLELFLQISDLSLKCELVDLMLGFQSEDLIVGLIGTTSSSLGDVAQFLYGLTCLLDLVSITFIYAVLNVLLLAHDVDVFAQSLVVRL